MSGPNWIEADSLRIYLILIVHAVLAVPCFLAGGAIFYIIGSYLLAEGVIYSLLELRDQQNAAKGWKTLLIWAWIGVGFLTFGALAIFVA